MGEPIKQLASSSEIQYILNATWFAMRGEKSDVNEVSHPFKALFAGVERMKWEDIEQSFVAYQDTEKIKSLVALMFPPLKEGC